VNHRQFAVVSHSRRVRCTRPASHLLRLPPRVRLLLVLSLTVWLHSAAFLSPYSLKPTALGLFFHPSLSVSAAYADDVRYIYDDLGRLIAVVDQTAGEAATYQYDTVGNLLGIVRQPASTVAILNFTPKSGPVGTTVTIVGTGYSATQNTVTFNGTAATVTSATTTQLVVTVPSGATTGPITIGHDITTLACSGLSERIRLGSRTEIPTSTPTWEGIRSIELILQVYSPGLGDRPAQEAMMIGVQEQVTVEVIVYSNVVRSMTTVTARMAAICRHGILRG
jgi:YD repeat-containing protein